jgi:hypothetical protein
LWGNERGERSGGGSRRVRVRAGFGRSAELTHGHRWALFGFSLVMSLITFAVGLVGQRFKLERTTTSRHGPTCSGHP